MNETVSRMQTHATPIQDPSCQSEVSRRGAWSRASGQVSMEETWNPEMPLGGSPARRGEWSHGRERSCFPPPPRSSSIARAIARAANANDVMTHGFGFIAFKLRARAARPQVRSRWTNWIHVAPTGHFFSRLAISTQTTQQFLLCDVDFFNWFFFF